MAKKRTQKKIYCVIRTDAKIFFADFCKRNIERAIPKAFAMNIFDSNDFQNISIARYQLHCLNGNRHREYAPVNSEEFDRFLKSQGVKPRDFSISAHHCDNLDKRFYGVVHGHDCLDDIGTFSEKLGVYLV